MKYHIDVSFSGPVTVEAPNAEEAKAFVEVAAIADFIEKGGQSELFQDWDLDNLTVEMADA